MIKRCGLRMAGNAKNDNTACSNNRDWISLVNTFILKGNLTGDCSRGELLAKVFHLFPALYCCSLYRFNYFATAVWEIIARHQPQQGKYKSRIILKQPILMHEISSSGAKTRLLSLICLLAQCVAATEAATATHTRTVPSTLLQTKAAQDNQIAMTAESTIHCNSYIRTYSYGVD